jgi:LuxR family maltose regulon positive regulatory protein
VPHPAIEELRQTIDVAVAAGDPDAALVAVRSDARALAAEHGADFRALIATMPDESWQDDAVIASALAASFRAADGTRGSSAIGYLHAAEARLAHAGRESDPQRVTVWLAHAAALRSLGRLDAATDYLDRARALDDAGNVLTIPMRVRLSARYALEAGMIGLHLGTLDDARRHLEFAHGLAADTLTRAERIECLGGLALLDYVQSGLGSASDHIAAARELVGDTTLGQTGFAAPALVAQVLIATEQHDLPQAGAVEPEMLLAARGTDWEPFSFTAAGYLRLAQLDLAGGLDYLERARHGYRTWAPAGLGLSSAELIRASLLIHLDQGDEAWEILRDLPPYEHHLMCPARIIAQLRLRHGDLGGAAESLDGCERIADDHSPRTLVEVRILRAAIEYERGDYRLSDVMFDRGLATIARTGSRAPLRLVPPGTLAGLAKRALDRTQGTEVSRILQHVAERTAGQGQLIEALSDRELLVLAEVEKGSTVAGIAAALFISPNTVKTHLRRLYRKLGVTTRTDAIRKAKSLGLGRSITRDSPR